jgi:2-methylcitrate dehydratase PrpD
VSSNLTQTIAEYVHETSFRDIPAQGISRAKIAILDTLGVMVAGSRHRVGHLIADYVKSSLCAGPATVIARPLKTSPEMAALANGVMAHALDYDDHGHASTQSLPAAMALAEARNASGAELLLAYLLGREVCLHLSEQFDRGGWEGDGPKGRGWHSVGIMGSIGATAAAAKMLGLEPPAICTALGIASSLVGGLYANRGTMTKPLHAGNAARNGVLAATLADRGFTADGTIFTSQGGLVDAFNLPKDCNLEQGVKNLCDHFHIVKKGIGIKAYPACSPTHRYIEAMRRLRSRHQLTADTVESLSCTPNKSLRCLYPRTDLECKFSAAFSLAATLIDGEVNLQNCTEEFLNRVDVQALLARTAYLENTGGPGFVRVRTVQGNVYEEPLAQAKDLSTDEEIRKKFYGCTAPFIGETAARTIEELIANLELLPSLGDLTALLRSE